jgi:hypothetical protein
MPIRGRVEGGRLVVNEPTDLPDGTEVDLFAFDAGDGLDGQERARLHAALLESEADIAAGRLIDADEVLKRLRSA